VICDEIQKQKNLHNKYSLRPIGRANKALKGEILTLSLRSSIFRVDISDVI